MKTCPFAMKLAGLALLTGAMASAGSNEADPFLLDADTDSVNEGVLVLLPAPPGGPVHAHTTQITLLPTSLQDGWAQLDQCHTDLDEISRAQIVYRPGRVRKLAVVSSHGIGQAWVEGASVQLENVSNAASLCVRAESRVVHSLAPDRFVVRNGPFMRRFLDGFYPMHVTLDIRLPPGDWQLVESVPAVQPGFTIMQDEHGLVAEAWFEGRLETEFHFMPADINQGASD